MSLQRKALADKILILGVDGMDLSLTRKFLKEGIMPNVQKYIDRGSTRDDLIMQGAHPTITPPMWTTMATGSCPSTHGITCFWNQDHSSLDTMVYALDSRKSKSEPLWNVFAEAGKKTLVWHWPGSSWPPTSTSPNLAVVDGISPSGVGMGNALADWEKLVVADTSFEGVTLKPRIQVNNGAGCIITDLPDEPETNTVGTAVVAELDENGEKKVTIIELSESDGELGLDNAPIDIINSAVKEAKGWAKAPAGALEFTALLADGLVRRPCLILKNEEGKYDRVAMYANKKATDPIMVLRVEDGMQHLIEELPYKEKKVLTSRNIRLLDLAEDGSHLCLWFGMAVDITNDHLWHPTSFHDAIMDHVGPQQPTAVYGAFDPVLTKKLEIDSWDNYCAWQSKVLHYAATEGGFDVIYSHLHNVDAMGHKFWQYAKPRENTPEAQERALAYQDLIRDVYRETDEYLGSFLHFLDEGWTILIMSDHGLMTMGEEHPPMIGDAFGCNVRVLEELGFTAVKKDENGNDLKEIDWEHTKAFATRGGHIYINLKGRDPHGIVDPADKYEVEDQIITALYQYKYKGRRAIQLALRNKDAKVLGMYGPECGDIIYFLAEGFNRLHGDSLTTSTSYFDTSVSPMLIMAGKGIKENYKTTRIMHQLDFAPTVAVLGGVRMPRDCEGAPIYQVLTEEY